MNVVHFQNSDMYEQDFKEHFGYDIEQAFKHVGNTHFPTNLVIIWMFMLILQFNSYK